MTGAGTTSPIASSRLSHTDLNTRIIPHTDREVEEMADSIQAMGILQNLIGAELPDGTIGIVGGEGRRRGTGILVMRGVLDADTPFVPVSAGGRMRNNPCKTELKVARSQRNKLRTMSAKLKEMCCEWDGLSGWLETESEQLAESIDRHLEALEDQIREWSEGTDNREGY